MWGLGCWGRNPNRRPGRSEFTDLLQACLRCPFCSSSPLFPPTHEHLWRTSWLVWWGCRWSKSVIQIYKEVSLLVMGDRNCLGMQSPSHTKELESLIQQIHPQISSPKISITKGLSVRWSPLLNWGSSVWAKQTYAWKQDFRTWGIAVALWQKGGIPTAEKRTG